MKKILIVPRHVGVNTMPWAWLLSQSADFYSVALPPTQFMPVSAGAAGYYPEIAQDFFYSTLSCLLYTSPSPRDRG